jgi:peptidoglycan/LPS O-acetylase OafA/YrhL
MYAKRGPELAAVFGLAHLSTFYFEDYWIRFGKRFSKRFSERTHPPLAGAGAAGGPV